MTVDPHLANALKRAGAKAVDWTDARDKLIRQAIADGGSLREVAALVGLSHTAVGFIANGRPER